MNNKLQDLLKVLEKPENMDMDQLGSLVQNSLSFFNDFIELSKGGDKEATEKALKELLEFKDTLQELTQNLASKTGLSQEELAKFLHNPSNFSEKDWGSMKEINDSINSFSKSILAETIPQMQKNTARIRKGTKAHKLSV